MLSVHNIYFHTYSAFSSIIAGMHRMVNIPHGKMACLDDEIQLFCPKSDCYTEAA
jgi:hypothetical protein